MHKTNTKHKIISYTLIALLFLPFIATVIYSLSSTWGATILPDGFSLKWYKLLLADERFLAALGRSFKVILLSLTISTLVIIPSIVIIYHSYPKLLKVLDLIAIMPFTVPAVVMAVGLLKLYSNGPLVLTGTIWILAGAHFTIVLPFMYRSIRNSLAGIDVKGLMEAATILGASKFQALMKVIIPNLKKGIISSVLLSFSFLFGEFLYSNLLAGGTYETIQVYLFNMRGKSGHFTSAIIVAYFTFILFTTLGVFKINSLAKKEKR